MSKMNRSRTDMPQPARQIPYDMLIVKCNRLEDEISELRHKSSSQREKIVENEIVIRNLDTTNGNLHGEVADLKTEIAETLIEGREQVRSLKIENCNEIRKLKKQHADQVKEAEKLLLNCRQQKNHFRQSYSRVFSCFVLPSLEHLLSV